ncbi:D-xylose transporter subunit XylF [Niallia circulans]|jgi:D-xylose transport system substrate-binding protein|uniref:D-xylose-binding periplasmic protein n=1 Tax=Niallia circulans TaxID=1397 RepID=A0A0J1ILD9_NIACI|nr:D-xylose ABC transporter substrate-binding protein [Niallia circulans]KLV26688.1 D-xylose transporter subunit XylF [Niallia circulans]NRG34056.1 D-xylose ABC transporter substrate-binding protein [Niallia circulans]PAD24193.1 D-xylose ABC transporter substrate-binding protein [Niallia circulans]PAE11283.1 D-xylose ABC transporter substrate-binding protein [Niallia circulans]
MKKCKGLLSFVLILSLMFIMAACGQDANGTPANEKGNKDGGGTEKNKVTIGLSVSDLTLERWQHDRDFFVEKAEELGANVLVQSANGDEAKQLSQIQNMLSQGIDALVIIAINSDALSTVVDQAKAEGIPVLAYDRLINGTDIDAYVSFDNVRVGEMQAEYLVEKVPSGKYFLMGGSPTDNNAKMFREGQMNIIQPLVDKGDIEIVGDQWAKDWDANEALKIMENALTANKNDIDAVVASNDSTAGGAIQALEAQDLAGKVVISGQDADLAGVQRIAEGVQTMTVYKPIKAIATKSAEVAVQLGKGEKVSSDSTVNNGKIDVPFIKLDPIKVGKENIVDTVVKDGFHSYDDIYKNVPENERPERP